MNTVENPQGESLNLNIGEIILYQPDDTIRLDVKIEDETAWLTQAQMVILFDSSKANISEHIKHIYETGELDEPATVRKFRTVRTEGKRKISRTLEYYSLDVIIAVGYRVNTKRGTQFRIWATRVLKEYLLRGYVINQRIERIEQQIEFLVKTTYTMGGQLQNEVHQLKQYVETIIADNNDINEDTRMQLELINETLAELQSKNKWIDKPRNPIGFKK